MKNVLEIIGIIITIAATLGGFIFTILRFLRKIEKRFVNVEDASKFRKEENIILIKATLAICDGLGQLGANGPVTECKNGLQQYLIERGE